VNDYKSFDYKSFQQNIALSWNNSANNNSIINYRCQFHQRFMGAFFIRKFVQIQNVTIKKAFVRKIRAFNVDEIGYRFPWIFSVIVIFLIKISNLEYRKQLTAAVIPRCQQLSTIFKSSHGLNLAYEGD